MLFTEFHLIVQNTSGKLCYVIYDMTTGQYSEPYTIPAHNNSMVNRRQLQLFKHQINSDSPATSWYVELTVYSTN